MVKYSVEFKLELVKYYEENRCVYEITAKHFNVDFACVQRWVNIYKVHGVKGLIKNQQQYDEKFKQNVVEYMHDNYLYLQGTAIQFNLAGDWIVSKWELIYYVEGP